MKSKRVSKTGLPSGWASKGRGKAILDAQGPLSTGRLWSANIRLEPRYSEELARCRQLGCADTYRSMFDYRHRPRLGSSYSGE